MRLVVALALAGCFGKPGFSGKDAAAGEDGPGTCTPTKPTGTGLTVDVSAADTHVTFLDGSLVGFSNANTRYPLPNRLIVANQDLVATPEGCAYEDQVGVAVYPVFNIGAQTLTGNPTHALEPEIVGPAYTLLRTHWTIALPGGCGGTTRGSGNTSWAFLPDGKIVRNDTITPTEMVNISAGVGCSCPSGGGSNFLVTSYTTFELSRLSAVTRSDDGADQNFVPATSIAARGACARGTMGGKVAVWWDRLDSNDPAVAPTRLRHDTNPGTSHAIFAFVYDMVRSQDMATTLTAMASYGIRTHMLLSAGQPTCTDMLATVQSFAVVQQIDVGPAGGSSIPVNYNADGVYDDSTTYTGPITIDGTVPPGFAVHVRFPGFTAVSTNRAADRVVWQRQTDGTFILFFRDGLDAIAPITVTPECAS